MSRRSAAELALGCCFTMSGTAAGLAIGRCAPHPWAPTVHARRRAHTCCSSVVALSCPDHVQGCLVPLGAPHVLVAHTCERSGLCKQALAAWLDIPRGVYTEWHAIAQLEGLVAQQQGSKAKSSAQSASAAGAVAAFAELQACAPPRQALYAAQLFHALHMPALTVRQLHKVTHATGADVAKGDARADLQVRCHLSSLHMFEACSWFLCAAMHAADCAVHCTCAACCCTDSDQLVRG
jgi:hypothetical protein